MIPYKGAKFNLKAFNCPHCNAYSNQNWYDVLIFSGSEIRLPNLRTSICTHCTDFSLWLDGKMIYPNDVSVPLPNPDLNKDIIDDYLEARSISMESPRGAAALLRLCIQEVCQQLGEKGDNINDDIANLVKKGLSPLIQKSLDTVRVIGNNAVHPGQIDLRDNIEVTNKLFELVNLVAETMISQPKRVKEIYESLPKSQIDAIEERDKK